MGGRQDPALSSLGEGGGPGRMAPFRASPCLAFARKEGDHDGLAWPWGTPRPGPVHHLFFSGD
jgi:hypothetical protein